jgi:dUTP pyrophosphatase
MSSNEQDIPTETKPPTDDSVQTTNEKDDIIDPARIANVLQNNDDAQDIMEKMFGALMQNPEMLNVLGSSLGDPEGGLEGILGSIGQHCKDGGKEDGKEDGTIPATVQQNENIPTPDGLNDITSTIQDGDCFPHEITRTITELEDTRCRGTMLHVKFANDDIRALYDEESGQHATDSGWDLKFTEDATVAAGALSHAFDFGVSVCCYDTDFDGCALWLLPRSSLAKTPLRLANSVGLIDASYRGTLKAFVDNRNNDEPFSVKKGDRLFQLASPSLAPLTVKVVKTLPATERGENGFGSTGV